MKGIFCIEGIWDYERLHRGQTVRPILELLSKDKRVPFVHRDCATTSDVMYYLEQFTLKRYARFPILYFAFHGTPGNLLLGDGNMSLDEIEGMLYHQCSGCVIVFGTCSTLGVSKRRIDQFLSATQAKAVCGYASVVDWIPATAMELMTLYLLTQSKFRADIIDALRSDIERMSRIAGVPMRVFTREGR